MTRRDHWRLLEALHEVMTAENAKHLAKAWRLEGLEPNGGAWVVRDVTAQGRGRRPTVEWNRTVWLSHTVDESAVAYFVALHELGHVLQHRVNQRKWRRHSPLLTLDAEADAWQFALDNAVEEPTTEVWRHIARMLGTYAAAPAGTYKPSRSFGRLLRRARKESREDT